LAKGKLTGGWLCYSANRPIFSKKNKKESLKTLSMHVSPVMSFVWSIILLLVCFRPFISEYVYPNVGGWYVASLILFSSIYLAIINERILFPFNLNLWPALLLITILFSMLYTGYSAWSLSELYFFIPNILIFYVASKIKARQQKQLLTCIFVAAFIISAYSVYQYFFGLPHTLEYLGRHEHNSYLEKILINRRVFATFISPNIFASYVVMMLFVTMGLLNYSEVRKKSTYIIAIIVMALSLLFTKSFGGILAFATTLLLFCYYSLQILGLRELGKQKIKLGIAFVVFSLIVISAVFLLRDRLLQFFNLRHADNSIVHRFLYWKASLNIIKGFPLTGVGWAQLGVLYGFYKPHYANISYYSHNVFLQVLVELGPLGLSCFLLILIMFLKHAPVAIRNNSEQKWIRIGLFCAGCSFLIHNLIDLSFYFSQAAFFWWMVLGLFSNFCSES